MQLDALALDPVRFALASGLLLTLALVTASLRPRWIVDHPRLVIGVVALVSVAACAVLVRLDPPGLRLSIDPSAEPLLPTGDPAQGVYRAAVRDFGDDEVYVIAVAMDDAFSEANLRALRRLSERIERLPGVRSVQSLVDVTTFRFSPEQDWIEVTPLIEEIPTDPAELARLRARALDDPLLRRVVVSDDGQTAALNVSFRKMTDREFIETDLDGRIAAILAEEAAPGRSFHVAGRPHVKSTVYRTMLSDLRVLLPVAVLCMAAVLAATGGSLRAVVLPLGSVGVATLWTFAGLALLERPITILTTLLAPNLIVIGSVYGVHVLERYQEDAASDASPRDAALHCLEHVTSPVLISGITTVIGFASLLVTQVPAVYELGAFSVLGVTAVTLLSLTLVPAALALLPLRTGRVDDAGRGGRLGRRLRASDRFDAVLGRALDRVEVFCIRHSGAVISVGLAVSLAAAVAIPRIEIDTDYLSFFDEDAPVRRDFQAVNERLAGAVPLYVVLDGGAPGAFREPVALAALERAQAEIDALPGVTATVSAVDTLRRLNRAVEGDDPAAERVPETRGGVAELLNLMPKGELGRLSTANQGRMNLVVRTGEVGSASIRRLTERLEAVLADGVLPAGMGSAVTGNAILLSRSADGIASGQAQSVALAAGSIFVLVAVGLRSVPLGLVAMAPNLVPVLIFFGLLGAGVAPLSLPTSLIGSVALGISIDDTAHTMVRYRAERRAGRSPEEAARRSWQSVGRGALTAGAMLCIGFGVVALSGFATLREFGLLSAATMAICVIADLVLLPAMLVRWRL